MNSKQQGFKGNTLAGPRQSRKINSELCRRLWAGEKITTKIDYYDFADVELKPNAKKPIPIWYGGGTPASCRRAADYCDGWMPGRIPMATFIKMVGYLREQYKARDGPWAPSARFRSSASTRISTPLSAKSTRRA
jgi:alkanesulfonate monooxygenase SsuD/methylene tetrahydromethanopterin reductase-like flavin-dependent oxidoreductase (luciferase family)